MIVLFSWNIEVARNIGSSTQFSIRKKTLYTAKNNNYVFANKSSNKNAIFIFNFVGIFMFSIVFLITFMVSKYKLFNIDE